jgi:hypothetical protein
MLRPWMNLAVDTILLGLEVQTVVGIRLSQIAFGRGTPAETQLTVTEKLLAFVEAATVVATGGSAYKVVRGFRKHVNVGRLRRA